MDQNIEIKIGNDSITVEVSIHNDFIECEELRESPFYHMQKVLPQGFDGDGYQKIVIRCIIPEAFRLSITQKNQSGQNICYDARDRFIEMNLAGKRLTEIEGRHCNHFENQYKYVIEN